MDTVWINGTNRNGADQSSLQICFILLASGAIKHDRFLLGNAMAIPMLLPVRYAEPLCQTCIDNIRAKRIAEKARLEAVHR